MPKSALTGSEKKTKKLGLKGAREREKIGIKAFEKGIKGIQRVQEGKGALPSSLQELQERYARALRGTEGMFEKQKENVIAEYQQTYAPQVRGEYGAASGQGSRSSALNQALAAAQTNLARGLNADYEALRNNVASNLLGQSQQAKLSNLNAQLSASGALSGQNVNPVAGNLAGQASYLPSNNQPNMFRKIMAGGSTIAGGVAGGLATAWNPAGIAAGVQGGSSVGQMFL